MDKHEALEMVAGDLSEALKLIMSATEDIRQARVLLDLAAGPAEVVGDVTYSKVQNRLGELRRALNALYNAEGNMERMLDEPL